MKPGNFPHNLTDEARLELAAAVAVLEKQGATGSIQVEIAAPMVRKALELLRTVGAARVMA